LLSAVWPRSDFTLSAIFTPATRDNYALIAPMAPEAGIRS
jgi:hypothetical protein